jgi:glycosyltransferase 2 family protein
MGGLRHPERCAVAAVVTFVLSWLIAIQRPVPRWELRFTEWINGAPDWFATVLYPLMQLGTLAAPLVVALAILVFRRDRLLAGATVGAGLVAWFGAKVVKRWIERGRPLEYLPGINVRDGTGAGLGFISGHSAVVAATVTMIALAVVPRSWRWVVVVAGFLVGLARVVHGVHLPADVLGGWSFGVLIGLGAFWVVDRIHDRLVRRPVPTPANQPDEMAAV